MSIDPPYRFDPFRTLVNVGWGAGGYITLEYFLSTDHNQPIGQAFARLPWTSTPLDLTAPGVVNLSIGSTLALHKNQPNIATSESQRRVRGFLYINIAAAARFAVNGRFRMFLDMPGIGGVVDSTGTFYVIWDTSYGSYENNLAHPFSTGNPCSGFAPNDPRSVMFVPHPCDLTEANCIISHSISPAYAIHSETSGISAPFSGHWDFQVRSFKTRKVFPVDVNNNPVGDWRDEAASVGSASQTGTQPAITKTVNVKYSDRAIAIS